MEQKTQKLTYATPELEIIRFETEDVITGSSEGGTDGGEGGL